MVSAFAADDLGPVLGQMAVEDKNNEITAIPELLRLLDLKGCTVTIDAMDAHKTIAAQIVSQGGDYLLTLKDNHPVLCADVARLFGDAATLAAQKPAHAETIEKDHGRIETRRAVALVRKDHAPLNLTTVRRVALSLAKRDNHTKSSVRLRLKRAAWDDAYLFCLLNI